MMIIEGGKITNLSRTRKKDCVSLLLSGIRLAESNISDLKTICKKLNDEELNNHLDKSYNELLNTLKYIKNKKKELSASSGNLKLV